MRPSASSPTSRSGACCGGELGSGLGLQTPSPSPSRLGASYTPFPLPHSHVPTFLTTPRSYLPEYRSLGTAGGLYHFRDSILRAPVPQHIFICNIDIATSFPFAELLEVHNKHRGVGTIMGVPVKKEVATRYGSIVHDPETAQVLHYVEKPQGWISNTANGGVYCALAR